MRQTLSKGVFAAAAATGILSLYGAPAFADAHAEGAVTDSPGVLSGNSVQAPVEVPVNVCGNTVGVVSAFNEASDSLCANTSQQAGPQSESAEAEARSGTRTSAERSYDGHGGGAHAEGVTKGSPGVASGNLVQAPVHAPVNVCGNNVDVIGAFNEASDNDCSTTSHGGGGGGAQAEGVATDSSGVASGNLIQVPLGLPLNVCGNSVNLVGLFNGTSDSDCRNEQGPAPETETETERETPATPPTRTHTPPPAQVVDTPPQEVEEPGAPPHLAETGSEGMLAASAAGATLLVGGALLYRRSRAALRG
ncbi:chaplin [Streptomyces sp. NPDC058442]|uniref:chaplin n=1 Tax=Streptomyces sp. NPDC058442 TaxID=3346503 RepID=UPI0036622360